MLRILKMPLRASIPDAPDSESLADYRDATAARIRTRCRTLRARRLNKLSQDDVETMQATEMRMAALAKVLKTHPLEQLCAAAYTEGGGVEVLSIIVAPLLDATVRKAYSELQTDVHLGIDLETVRDV